MNINLIKIVPQINFNCGTAKFECREYKNEMEENINKSAQVCCFFSCV